MMTSSQSSRLTNLIAYLCALLLLACGESSLPPSPSASGGANNTDASVENMGGAGSGNATDAVGDDLCEGVSCAEGFVCASIEGEAQCECEEGLCEDLDDYCSAAPCDSNASCTSFDNGYRCRCADGFSGSGFSCTPGDLCDGYLCGGRNTACSSDGVNATCSCFAGFELSDNGLDCQDIDECSKPDTCEFGQVCLNRPSTFSCDCIPGYEASGEICVDVSECSQANGCSALSMSCIELEGSYQCSCPATEVSDGTFCKSTASCTAGACNGNGNCFETPSSSLCSCFLGFVGSTCSDSTTCASGLVLNSAANPVLSDPVLRAAVEEVLGLDPAEEFTVGDLANFSELFVPPPSDLAGRVTSLDGLHCFSNLTSLELPGHGVSDLSPLERLYQLETLDLSCNPITDLADISSLRFLENLSLSQTGPCLTSGAQFTSLSGKIDSFVDLRVLDVEGLGLTNLSGFNALVRLRELTLVDNAVSPISDLTSLTSLVSLNATGTNENSLIGLENFISLRTLNLSGTPITSLVDLKKAPQLRTFIANDVGLTSLAGAGDAPLLNELRLNQNSVTSLASLKGSTSLVSIGLTGNRVASLSDLVIDSGLKLNATVDLRDNEVSCETSYESISALGAAGVVIEVTCP